MYLIEANTVNDDNALGANRAYSCFNVSVYSHNL